MFRGPTPKMAKTGAEGGHLLLKSCKPLSLSEIFTASHNFTSFLPSQSLED